MAASITQRILADVHERPPRPRRRIGAAVGVIVPLLLLVSTSLVSAVSPPTKNGPTPTMGHAGDRVDCTILGDCVYFSLNSYSSSHPWSEATGLSTAVRDFIDELNAGRQARTPSYEPADANHPATLHIYYGGTDVAGICGSTSALACRNGNTLYLARWHLFSWVKYCDVQDETSCYDIGNIVLHEVGHRQGLAHYPDISLTYDKSDGIGEGACDKNWVGPAASITVMQCLSRHKGVTGYTQHQYGSCDIATLQMIWGLYSSASKVPMCPGLARRPTALALSQSHTGTQVTFTATFKFATSDTLTVYAGQQLGNQSVAITYKTSAISSRTVVLQLLGDDGVWRDSVTMTPGASGTYTYTRSQPTWAATSWRAVFRAPADDNLLADTTASVSVPQGICTTICPV